MEYGKSTEMHSNEKTVLFPYYLSEILYDVEIYNSRIIPSMTFVPIFSSKIFKLNVSLLDTMVPFDLPSNTDIWVGVK